MAKKYTGKNVTIFTDASMCQDTKAGGWACWIKCDSGQLEYSGEIKAKLKGSACAEWCALANGLNVAAKAGMLDGHTMVIFVTDCQAVADKINANGKPKFKSDNPIHKKAYDLIWKLLREERKMQFKANHVKAHKGTGSPRRWVNDRVDKLAKKHMREKRKKLGYEKV